MAEKELNFNEEEEVRDGGEEAEEDGFDEAVESAKEGRVEPDAPVLQTPTELAGGGGTAGPGEGLHQSGPADT